MRYFLAILCITFRAGSYWIRSEKNGAPQLHGRGTGSCCMALTVLVDVLTVLVDVPPRDREVLESWLRAPSVIPGFDMAVTAEAPLVGQ